MGVQVPPFALTKRRFTAPFRVLWVERGIVKRRAEGWERFGDVVGGWPAARALPPGLMRWIGVAMPSCGCRRRSVARALGFAFELDAVLRPDPILGS